MENIPKLCECGCGKFTMKSKYTKKYNNFIKGHSTRKNYPTVNTTHFCKCGCGLLTKMFEGKPKKFINHHWSKTQKRKSHKLIYQDEDITKFLIESPKYGNFEILIDTKNYNKIKEYRWRVIKRPGTFYATTTFPIKNKKLTISIHELLFKTKNKMIDHKDRNGLNNLESNIRQCTHQQNMSNRGLTKNNTSGYKGVSWHKGAKKWKAVIEYNNKIIHLGCFEDKIGAAKAYNEAALIYHGEFAYLNDI
jgi:hypothetical protein